MALSRSLESRWIRRYRSFFVLGCLILSIQVFLAYKFLSGDVYNNNNNNNIQNQKETFVKSALEVLSDDLNGGVSSRKFKESYLTVDDEDSPSNSNPVNVLFRKHKVPPDKYDFLSEVRINLDIFGKVPQTNLKTNMLFASNQSVLRLEELNFMPPCDVATKEAVSAIRRAKTQQCKQEIVNVTCLTQQGRLYPTYLPNSCPTDGFTSRKSLGCYRDNQTFRLLSGYFANLKITNSPQHCINMCLQSGFPYAGVQFVTQCFCGNDEPPSTSRLPDSSCNMKCPADPKEACGGYFTINVYETGIKKFVPQLPMESLENAEHPIRIAFLLTLNGRALRQVHRLIKALFHMDHYFYIHVDARQDYLFRELLPLEEKLQNVRLARKRFATIWGGASLLRMLLSSMTELLEMDWQWDFIINLSESDFPVKTNVQLVNFLSANKEKNFVKSHGREVQRFIQKQGLDKTFVECDARMWRTGDRNLPWGIQVDGGSDWVALSRPFVSYVASAVNGKVKDELLRGLSVVFKHTLLPAETFFHTVLRNSKFCNTYIDNNLHVTNWKRRLGCKCQYKHVVDWCGCSPNDFRLEDWPRLQGTEGRMLFFARKFEPIINQAIIDQVEEWLYGAYPTSMPSLHSYWQNLYHHADLSPPADDALVTLAMSFARLSTKHLPGCVMEPRRVLEVTSYHVEDSYAGTLILFEATEGNHKIQMESLVQPQQFFSLENPSGVLGRLKSLHVSSEYDQKEQVSRNFVNALGPFSELVLIYIFEPLNMRENSNIHKIHPAPSEVNVTLLWIDPAGRLADVSEFHLDVTSNIGSVKPFLREPLLPGVWKVKLIFNSTVVASSLFLVSPLQLMSGAELSEQQAGYLHNISFMSREFSEWDKFISNKEDTYALHKKAVINSQRVGGDLLEWIDGLSSRFYKILDLCVVEYRYIVKDSTCSEFPVTPCSKKKWSSTSPDPKSEITNINNSTGQLNRLIPNMQDGKL